MIQVVLFFILILQQLISAFASVTIIFLLLLNLIILSIY